LAYQQPPGQRCLRDFSPDSEMKSGRSWGLFILLTGRLLISETRATCDSCEKFVAWPPFALLGAG
ncbi:MAG: hypothetical protein EB035_03035, partial [Actinobacteria bacterium]|nr:hypothetical protein [Actinomycetota bacterium]